MIKEVAMIEKSSLAQLKGWLAGFFRCGGGSWVRRGWNGEIEVEDIDSSSVSKIKKVCLQKT